MKTRTCSKCGSENTLRSKKCFNCGAPLTAGGKLNEIVGGVITLVVIVLVAYNVFFK